MPTGSSRAAQRGFTYLWLLFVLAAGSALLAAHGTQWRTALQREREIELEFRGGQIARALGSYAAASPQGSATRPQRLQDLLDDRRGLITRRHLRRLYDDPFSGEPDWALLTDGEGRIRGVHSRSALPALRVAAAAPAEAASSPAQAASAVARVSDRHFLAALPATPAASGAAPAASAAVVRSAQP